MKRIVMRPKAGIPPMSSKDALLEVASLAGGTQGIPPAEMRKRMRIIDKLEALDVGALDLEDADHEYLLSLLNVFPFARVSKEMLQIIDDVANATAPPKAAPAPEVAAQEPIAAEEKSAGEAA